MNFFEEVQRCKTMEDIGRLLKKYNLKAKIEISLWNKIKKLLGLSYSAKIYIYNDIVTYEIDCEILEMKSSYPLSTIFININLVKVI